MESSSKSNGGFETPVVLNVYDLTPLNNYTYWFGFGIFHSGIEGNSYHYLLFLLLLFYLNLESLCSLSLSFSFFLY